jgi:hypothetical protein
MSKVADILARCKDLVQGIVPAANVYDFTPYGKDEKSIRDIMLDASTPPIIHFWAVTRESTPSDDLAVGGSGVQDKHKLVFRGWYGLNDDGELSGKAFTEEIESIRQDFRSNRSLKDASGPSGQDAKCFFCSPMQVRTQITGSFAGFLVHYAEVTMECQDYPLDYDNTP